MAPIGPDRIRTKQRPGAYLCPLELILCADCLAAAAPYAGTRQVFMNVLGNCTAHSDVLSPVASRLRLEHKCPLIDPYLPPRWLYLAAAQLIAD